MTRSAHDAGLAAAGGITAGSIASADAEKILIGTLANYGYENTVLLPVPLTVAPASTPASSP
jgi:thiol:disulfide interchange protein DsbD